jgi:hypothetical protein
MKPISYNYTLYEDGTIIKSFSQRKKNKTSFTDQTGKVHGQKQKHFYLNPTIRRQIRCAALRQYQMRKYKILFCTLTFPEKISEKQANECFSKYVENLKLNYNLNSYVAVRENQNKKGGYHLHYHCLFDIPFTDFKKLNSAWCNTFRGHARFSVNAFTTGRNKFATDIRQVSAYISKYMAKSEYKKPGDFKQGEENKLIAPESRIFFVSDNVNCSPAKVPEVYIHYLMAKKAFTRFESDYFTVFIFHDFTCLPEDEAKKCQIALSNIQKRKEKPKKPKPKPDAMQPNFCF